MTATTPPALSELDVERLRQTLALAQEAVGLSDPNPRVGCVIGTADGRVLGSGHTQAAGLAHAEVMALRSARAAGADVRGATAWVSLEPCAHQGRTPPCCDALVEAGIARVVAALEDPFPLVAGRGLARLRAAGIETVVAGGLFARECRELNIGFFSRVQRGRPWLRLKIAMSLDGRTALLNGRSQWITGDEARTDGHRWRRRAGAVLTGIGTVLADDPRLDVRDVPTVLQPRRAVVDTNARLPASARIIHPPGCALAYVGAGADTTHLAEACASQSLEIVPLPMCGGHIDLERVVVDLHGRDINEIHVEAGAALNAAFLAKGIVDELLVYIAPRLIGPGRPAADLPALDSVSDAHGFRLHDVARVGSDLRLQLRP